jgi:hypothetical protein
MEDLTMNVAQDKVTILKECVHCKVVHLIDVKQDDLIKYKDGMHVQHAFPYLSASDRELFISNTCEPCWDKMMGEEEGDFDGFATFEEWINSL